MAQVSFRASVGKVHGLKFSQDNKPRFAFSAAENHSRFNKQTSAYEDTGVTWFNITVFGKLAEDMADIIQEGAKQFVVVTGRQSTRPYTTENGEQRTSLDVVADNVGLVHRAPQQGQPPAADPAASGWGTPVSPGGAWGGSPQGQGANPPF